MMRVGLKIGLAETSPRGSSGGGASYDADAQALFDAWDAGGVGASASEKTEYNSRIVSLKSAGIWAKLDSLLVPAVHNGTAALFDWKDPTRVATAVNSPTFTAYRGYQGDGVTQYINMNFVPATDAVNYALNDACLGFYSRSDVLGTYTDMGARPAGDVKMGYVLCRYGSNEIVIRLNVSAFDPSGLASSVSSGMFLINRDTSSNVRWSKDGIEIVSSGASNSQAIPDLALYAGARNNAGTATSFSPRQYSILLAGASLHAHGAAFQTIMVDGYLQAIGAKV